MIDCLLILLLYNYFNIKLVVYSHYNVNTIKNFNSVFVDLNFRARKENGVTIIMIIMIWKRPRSPTTGTTICVQALSALQIISYFRVFKQTLSNDNYTFDRSNDDARVV